MAKSLSFDLRSRVLAAIANGLSCASSNPVLGSARQARSAGRRCARRGEMVGPSHRAGSAFAPHGRPCGPDRRNTRRDTRHTLPEPKKRLAARGASTSVTGLGRYFRDAAELLGVDVDQLARPIPLVTADRRLRVEGRELA